VLARRGIRPDAQGLAGFFATFTPDEAQRTRIRNAIRALASEQEARRGHALRTLRRAGVGADAPLAEALDAEDPEVRRRARALRRRIRSLRFEAVPAALRLIHRDELPGLAAPLLRIAPYCDANASQRHQLELALRATATRDDVSLLRRTVAEGPREARRFALVMLAAVVGPGARDELESHLTDPDGRTAVAAARALADLRDPACVPALVELLEYGDPRTRREAAHVLRAVTGRRFGYTAAGSDASRRASVARWRAHVAGHAIAPQWKTPIRMTRPFLDRTLLVDLQGRKVVETDADGRTTWTQEGLAGVWAAAGSPTGRRVVGLIGSSQVILYDAGGRELWRTARLPGSPMHVSFADNGHVLVCCGAPGRKLIELDPKGRTVWQYSVRPNAFPLVAQRLPNGRTLVATTRRVLELRIDGSVVWESQDVRSPVGATRMPNGHTLVFDARGRRLVVLDTEGRKISEAELLEGFHFFGQALRNGRYLLSGRNRVREIDGNGRVFWERRGDGPLKAVRY